MPSEKLLERARRVLRLKHYAYRTEQHYLTWIRRFILFHSKRHPIHMDQAEIEAFLTHLAIKEKVPASTHTIPGSNWDDQPLSSLSFLYREGLGVELDSPFVSVCSKRNKGFGKA